MEDKKHKESVVFHPKQRHDSRLKILFALRGLFFLIVPFGFTFAMRDGLMDHLALSLLLLGIDLVFIFAGARFLVKAFDKEQIIVTPDALIIQTRKWLITNKISYSFTDISEIAYIGPGHKTDHPLKGTSYDYLGFETRELEISRIHNQGHLSLVWHGVTVYFGKNVYSWDAQKINAVILDYSDGSLSIQGLPDEVSEMTYKYSS
jgi:hypothetical protein